MLGNGLWNGLPDREGNLWIGGEFAQPVQVLDASADWDFNDAQAAMIVLEYLDSDGEWRLAQVLRDGAPGHTFACRVHRLPMQRACASERASEKEQANGRERGNKRER